MTQSDAADFPDFTISRPPHRFRIDEDVFEAPGWLAPFTLKLMAKDIGEIGEVNAMTGVEGIAKAIDATGHIMAALMPGEWGQRFQARLQSEGGPEDPKPIDLMAQAIPALYYLLECYGLRPTVPSSSSPTGSTDGQTNTPSDGTSSTAGASPEESTSEV